MYITSNVNCMCSAEEEQCLLRLGADKLKHPVVFFTPKAIPGKNASREHCGLSDSIIQSNSGRVMCFPPK